MVEVKRQKKKKKKSDQVRGAGLQNQLALYPLKDSSVLGAIRGRPERLIVAWEVCGGARGDGLKRLVSIRGSHWRWSDGD